MQRKPSKTVAEHVEAGLGLAFDFRLHGQMRSATWEGAQDVAGGAAAGGPSCPARPLALPSRLAPLSCPA